MDLHHLVGMNGFAGLRRLRKRKPEVFVLKRRYPSLREECADRVAGLAVLTVESFVGRKPSKYICARMALWYESQT